MKKDFKIIPDEITKVTGMCDVSDPKIIILSELKETVGFVNNYQTSEEMDFDLHISKDTIIIKPFSIKEIAYTDILSMIGTCLDHPDIPEEWKANLQKYSER